MYALNTARQMLAFGNTNAAINQIKAGLKCSNSAKVVNLIPTLLAESEQLQKIVASLLVTRNTEINSNL